MDTFHIYDNAGTADLTRHSVIYVVGGRIQLPSEDGPITLTEGDLTTVPAEPFSVSVMADASLLISQSVTNPSVVAHPTMTVPTEVVEE